MTMTTLSVRQFGERHIQTQDHRRMLAVIRRTGAFRGSNNWGCGTIQRPTAAPRLANASFSRSRLATQSKEHKIEELIFRDLAVQSLDVAL
jgi:hypothetical protein